MQRIEKVQPSRTVLFIRFYQLQSYLLGGLLLLLLLLLGLSLIFLCRGCFLYWRGCFFLLLLFLDGNEETNNILGLEGLDNKVIRVISISSHLLLEHLDHVVVGAGTSNLTKKTIKLSLAHQDTNIVKGTAEVIFVKGAILVDVHKLEAVLVHLQLVLGEPALILSLAHGGCELLLVSQIGNN